MRYDSLLTRPMYGCHAPDRGVQRGAPGPAGVFARGLKYSEKGEFPDTELLWRDAM